MQIARFALRNLWRDLKSGELSVLLLALSVAVLSLTAVGFFTSRISQGVRAQAAEVLAADLRLEAPTPILHAISTKLASVACSASAFISTAIFSGGIEPVGGAERSDVELSLARAPACTAPLRCAAHHHQVPGHGEVWIDARIVRSSSWNWDDPAHRHDRSASRVLDYRPDKAWDSSIAPAALLNYDDIASTQLVQEVAETTYAALFAGSPAVADFREF
jgi:putative ABC transport system permease protein